VPYPYAADDHQLANARALADAAAARVLAARPLPTPDVVRAITGAFANPAELQAMSARAARLARPDAAERIVQECTALVSSTEEGA
jgi:UDP-N-acetylglucosamine--N-acetylmuramyl-(pentapeptide) pyrophosphoryl-undecaprenol N-acetylglucosamine transferase